VAEFYQKRQKRSRRKFSKNVVFLKIFSLTISAKSGYSVQDLTECFWCFWCEWPETSAGTWQQLPAFVRILSTRCR
jgi:hypothetical protein